MGKIVKATVAENKTVLFNGKYVGPGGEVQLDADEVKELQGKGFLVDPDAAPAPAKAEGPTFESQEGPTIS